MRAIFGMGFGVYSGCVCFFDKSHDAADGPVDITIHSFGTTVIMPVGSLREEASSDFGRGISSAGESQCVREIRGGFVAAIIVEACKVLTAHPPAMGLMGKGA